MRTLVAFAAAALLLTQALPARAADAPSPHDEEIGTLIRDLASDSYQTREDATQRLVGLGELALPRLQTLLPLTVDGETRSRIQSAIDQILESSAAGETLITLDVKDADPKAVFAEFSRQARAEIRPPADLLASLPPLTFQCDHEPFWPALKRLCSPLGLAPDSLSQSVAFGRRAQAADHVLNLVRAGDAWDRTPTAFSGPFMLTVQRITRTGVVLPATGQRVHNVMVECVVHAEPKLTVVGRNPTARVIEPDPAAANAAPGAVAAAPPGFANFRPPFSARSYYNPSGASAWSVVVPLSLPRDAGDTLPQLKATSSAKVLVRSETWELPDIARAAPRSWEASGRTFSVTSVNRQGDAVELVATATRRSDARGPEAAEDAAVFNTLDLLDPQGRPLVARSRSPRPSETPSTLTYSIVFEATPEGAPILPASTPLRLRWRLPLETKDLDLAITFPNLPLP